MNGKFQAYDILIVARTWKKNFCKKRLNHGHFSITIEFLFVDDTWSTVQNDSWIVEVKKKGNAASTSGCYSSLEMVHGRYSVRLGYVGASPQAN